MKISGILLLFLISTSSWAALDYHSERLKMMDVETLQLLLSKNLKKLDGQEDEARPIIKQSLEVLLAQPNQSLAASNYFSQFQIYAGGQEEFLAVLNEIVTDGETALRQKSTSQDTLREQNTYLYILTNMVNEVKDSLDKPEYKHIVERIAHSNIKIGDKLASYGLLNSMSEPPNPKQYAQEVLPKKKPWWKFW